MKTVPNQRIIKINKSPTDKQHLYTTNNLQALFDAMYNLTSHCGFKLYMYLAKNQNNYDLALSSTDFCKSACCSMSAYNTAFKELVEKGYLIQKAGTKNIFTFVDKVGNQEIETKTQEQEVKATGLLNAESEKKEIDLTTYKPEVIVREYTIEELYQSQGIKKPFIF